MVVTEAEVDTDASLRDVMKVEVDEAYCTEGKDGLGW
jgi:hypothetical protein